MIYHFQIHHIPIQRWRSFLWEHSIRENLIPYGSQERVMFFASDRLQISKGKKISFTYILKNILSLC